MEYSKENMFITGKAGSGKTTLLEYFRINSSKNFVILLKNLLDGFLKHVKNLEISVFGIKIEILGK